MAGDARVYLAFRHFEPLCWVARVYLEHRNPHTNTTRTNAGSSVEIGFPTIRSSAPATRSGAGCG